MKSYIRGIPKKEIYNYSNLMVSNLDVFVSDGIQSKEGVIRGVPLLKLCEKKNDATAYGIISQDQSDSGDMIDIDTIGCSSIWVVNKDGNFESGDIICSSDITGYGSKQKNNYITNCSFAKINMKCDFSPKLVAKKVMTLSPDGTYKYDSYDELIWTDTTELEYAYEIRYLDENGVAVSKQEYDEIDGYIAALVACTLF